VAYWQIMGSYGQFDCDSPMSINKGAWGLKKIEKFYIGAVYHSNYE